GRCRLTPQHEADLTDLPGTYSLYPKSLDEKVIIDLLYNRRGDQYPDFIIVTADAANLRRNLLLFTQLADLRIPAVLVLTMTDVALARGIAVDVDGLSRALGVPVIPLNARRSIGLTALRIVVAQNPVPAEVAPFYAIPEADLEHLRQIRYYFDLKNDYLALLYAHQFRQLAFLSEDDRAYIGELNQRYGFRSTERQAQETIARYARLNEVLLETVKVERAERGESASNRLDAVLTHRVWGYVIFVGVLLALFQAVFSVAQGPMDLIDTGTAALSAAVKRALPAGPLTDLLTDGVLAGLGGVLIFIPQIALLFLFIAVLEETGYMARVTFLMDKLMRPFGMSGKSVVPLISGAACAVPAVMAARTIESWRDRMVTIFVTPLISCSARLPVFTVLVGLVVPDRAVLGILNLRGLALMGLYGLGFAGALGSGLLLKTILGTRGGRSYFIMEFPTYQWPRWKNVALTILEKVRTFVFEAGKVIVAISVILWVLATYGPGDGQAQAEAAVRRRTEAPAAEVEAAVAAARLEASYAGRFGHAIEPVIRPLGFDWKIGIALLTSFAAREVFVGTMSTIYSVGQDPVAGADPLTIQRKLAEAKDVDGRPFFNPARAFSLLVFYVFAMQCMSTLAVVRRETRSWRWPLAQLVWMSALAYGAALLTYQVLR
ncbi:MAG: ferrous iron transport protein B, partial [Hymenobacteraceae bacterium]|nr:ferrous iron transport protein B [Hymenobacteraceae bacterium]